MECFRSEGEAIGFDGQGRLEKWTQTKKARMEILGKMFSANVRKEIGCLGLPLDSFAVGPGNDVYYPKNEPRSEYRF